MRKAALIMGLLALLGPGCAPGPASSLSTPSPIFVTSTLPATVAPSSTAPPPTSSPAPTATPRAGMTSTQLYVRGQPASSAAQLGLIGPATAVQILGRDPSGNWYQIAYAQAHDGKAWVAAQYVRAEDKDTIPVIGSEAGLGPSATVMQQINVRSGPGTDFASLGTLNPKDVVPLTGRDSSGTWLQIEYASGPGSRGWISAGYVQASGIDGLPIVAESGQVVGTRTATGVPPTPTATLAPAADDHDTADAPAVKAVFSPAGAGALMYSSDLSAPKGDPADWIAFTPYQSTVTIKLQCAGSSEVEVDLSLGNRVVADWGGLSCGNSTVAMLSPGKQYVLKLSTVDAGGQLAYVRYTVHIQGWP